MPDGALTLRDAVSLCGGPTIDNPIGLAETCGRLRHRLARERPDLPADALDEAAAAQLGISLEHLRTSLALRELGAEVRDLVADHELSVEQALALSRVPEARRQRALAREAIDQQLTPAIIRQAADLLLSLPQLRVRAAIQRACRSGSEPARFPVHRGLGRAVAVGSGPTR